MFNTNAIVGHNIRKLKLKVFKHVWSQVCLEIFRKIISFFCQKHFKIYIEIDKLTRVYETFNVGKVFRLKSSVRLKTKNAVD